MPKGYPARAERAVLFEVRAWDVNCPRHIPQKLDAAGVADVLAKLQTRIQFLIAENDKLRATARMSSEDHR
jgi:predicted pyridoxine 5'-phosphate oxidase superfamily flavin-nucleotide-binding protein